MVMPRRAPAVLLLAVCSFLPRTILAGTSSAAPSTAPASSVTPAPAPPPAPPPYTALRWDEDYSYLKDPANRTDFFDPIKYVPLGDESYASFGASARYRYEYYNNFNFGAGPQDDDGYHLTRILAHGDFHVTPYFRLFIQGKSSMEDGREGGPRPGDTDELDVQQAFADVLLPLADKTRLRVRVGRQEMPFGAQRLIAVADWSNVLRTFEGLRLSLSVPDDTLDVFWVRPALVEPEEPNTGDGNTSLSGIYNTKYLPNLIPGARTQLETYLLALNRSNSVDTDTYTLGTRFLTNPKPWDFEVEADYQFGDYNSDSICAYSLAVDAGYTLANLPLTPRPFVGFDIASGSPNPAHRFNQLFPNGHAYFGYIDVVARMNIIDIHPGVTFNLAKGLTLRVEDHTFWRQNVNDGLYNASGNLLRAADGSDAAYIGNELDFLLNWQIDRHLSAYLGYSHFFTGSFLEQTGPSKDIDFLYAAIQYTF